MGDAAEEGGARTVDADALEVFVPGRLCLLGEHSDWVRRLSPALSSHAAAAPAPIVHVLTRPCVPPSRRPRTVTDACVADSSRIQIPRCQWTCAPPHSLHTRGCEPHGHAHALTTSTRVELRQAGGFRSANPAIAKGCTLVVGTTQGLHASVKAHPTHLMLVRIRPTPTACIAAVLLLATTARSPPTVLLRRVMREGAGWGGHRRPPRTRATESLIP